MNSDFQWLIIVALVGVLSFVAGALAAGSNGSGGSPKPHDANPPKQ